MWASRLPRLVRRAAEILRPAIEERMERSADTVDWKDKPVSSSRYVGGSRG